MLYKNDVCLRLGFGLGYRGDAAPTPHTKGGDFRGRAGSEWMNHKSDSNHFLAIFQADCKLETNFTTAIQQNPDIK